MGKYSILFSRGTIQNVCLFTTIQPFNNNLSSKLSQHCGTDPTLSDTILHDLE